MTKEIKNYYKFLDLRYDSSIEDVKLRQKILIKLLRAKSIRTGNSNKEKIMKINTASNKIINFIKQNGVPNDNRMYFDTTTNSVAVQTFVLVILIIIITVSFLVLL